MTSHPAMNQPSPMLYAVNLGDKSTPVKLMFLKAPPPALEDYSDNSLFLSAEKDGKHATSFVTSQDSDATEIDHAGTLEADAEKQGVRKVRPCKGKRDRYKKLVKSLKSQILENPDSFYLEPTSLPPSLQRNGKQREKLMQQMQDFKYQVRIRQEAGSM